MASGGRTDAAGRNPAHPKGWRIASRMRIIVTVPLVAVIGFAGVALVASVRQADQASALGARVRLAADAGGLAYELQRERATAADLLTSGAAAQQSAFTAQIGQTDEAVGRYRAQRALITDATAGTRAVLARIDRALDALSPLRTQVRTAAQASVSAMTFSYRIVIADLLAYRESTAQGIAATDTADDLRAAAALSRISEAVGQEQVAVLRAVAAGQLTPALQQDITASRANFTESSLSFVGLARPAWRAWWEQAGSGAQALSLQRLQDQVSRTQPGDRLRLDTDAWIKVTQDWASRQLEVQRRIDGTIGDDVAAARAGQQRRGLAEGAATVLAILLTLAVTGAVARQITRRLRRLRDAANAIAFTKLPTMVAQLRASGGTHVEPEALAIAADPDLEDTADEIGDVGQAFSAVHRAAVRTAAEQAVMRANTAQIFVHLSRREQRLVDAVLAQVDKVEQDETDPERLDRLYTLDHLATRMARINASLLVLGGVGVGRVRHDDVSMAEVLQAALSQIEYYTRVRLGIVDAEVAVVADAVDEVVHLLAELMDNATTYSPPDTEAWATARGLGDRVIVQIGDEGVGLPAQRLAQLNQLLAAPPDVDVAAVRAMGLVVVGQLAGRLGARVELRPGPKLGTIAEVTLPAALIRPARALELPVAGRAPDALTAPGYAGTDGRGRGAGRNGLGHGHGHGYGGGPGNGSGYGNGHHRGNGRDVLTDGYGRRVTMDQPALDPLTGGSAGGHPDRAPTSRRRPGERALPAVPAQRRPPNAQNPRPGGAGGPGTDTGGAHQAAPGAPGAPATADGQDDRTQELPIFQQVNSWFRAGTTGEDSDDAAWRTPADEAWRAATEAATAEPTTTTKAGLPVRVPQAHLVPGGVDAPADRQAGSQRRDPAQVANAMSAFARGVAARHPALVNSTVSTDPTGSTQ